MPRLPSSRRAGVLVVTLAVAAGLAQTVDQPAPAPAGSDWTTRTLLVTTRRPTGACG